MDSGEYITSGFVITVCDGSQLLELAEKTRPDVVHVQVLVIKSLVRAMAFRRYYRGPV